MSQQPCELEGASACLFLKWKLRLSAVTWLPPGSLGREHQGEKVCPFLGCLRPHTTLPSLKSLSVSGAAARGCPPAHFSACYFSSGPVLSEGPACCFWNPMSQAWKVCHQSGERVINPSAFSSWAQTGQAQPR